LARCSRAAFRFKAAARRVRCFFNIIEVLVPVLLEAAMRSPKPAMQSKNCHGGALPAH
jgi:hypothetical protein